MKREEDPIEEYFQVCLDLWVRWMRGDMSPAGFAGLDSVCGQSSTNFMSSEDDSEIVYEKADRKLAESVNACVDSLMPSERLAIYIDRGLARAWPFLNLDRAKQFALGMSLLRKLVAKRC